jgi:uncharacterized small protein (DUF1192 family)
MITSAGGRPQRGRRHAPAATVGRGPLCPYDPPIRVLLVGDAEFCCSLCRQAAHRGQKKVINARAEAEALFRIAKNAAEERYWLENYRSRVVDNRVRACSLPLRLRHVLPARVIDARFRPHYGLKSDIAQCPKGAMNKLMRCNKNGAVSENRLSGVQLMEQRFGLLQIERVEALCEPLIDLGDRASGFVPLPLVAE